MQGHRLADEIRQHRQTLRFLVERHIDDELRRENTEFTRIELTAELDPFARDSISHLSRLESEIRKLLPDSVQAGTDIHVTGSTASIRDLKSVTDRDQIRIDVLVVVVVFLILVVLLRRPAICAYLMVTVFFSYLVALGATYL